MINEYFEKNLNYEDNSFYDYTGVMLLRRTFNIKCKGEK